MTTAEQIIELFKMKPPAAEGGFYMETYRAQERPTRTTAANPKADRSTITY